MFDGRINLNAQLQFDRSDYRLGPIVMNAFVTFLVSLALSALVVVSPTLTCHGQGAGGNCGEGYMASIPLGLILFPVFCLVLPRLTKRV
jgi:hypothetical protein